ncbi:putative RNA recognition motif domain, nucleotide-binding alpha-beta plait domain superfamily [Helianthus anomalus]
MGEINDGWEVQSNNRRGKGGPAFKDPVITKLFVSNIPQGCRPWDLADAFRAFGDIAGSFIAKKKDKEGRSFGFVSFKGVRNVDELLARLSNMKLGGNKLIINVALFAKENGNLKSSGLGGDTVPPKGKSAAGKPTGGISTVRGANNVQPGVSFLDILTNKSHAIREEDVIDIDPSELRFLKTFISSAGLEDARIQYLGGLTVLISFLNEDSPKRFFDDKEVWSKWFSSLDPWLGQSLPYERLAWVSVLGVPPHLLSKAVFDAIGNRYGKVVFSSQFSVSDGNLSFDRMGILLGSGNRINGSLSLRWQDKKYKVWVIEENNHWLSNFLEVEETSEAFSSELGGNKEILVPVPPTDLGHDALEVEKLVQVPDTDFIRRKTEGSSGYGGGVHFSGNVSAEYPRVDIERSKVIINHNSCMEGPTFKDNWVNLVAQTSPRPKKRRRGEDLFHLDEQVDLIRLDSNFGSLTSENNKGVTHNLDFNLNITSLQEFPLIWSLSYLLS